MLDFIIKFVRFIGSNVFFALVFSLIFGGAIWVVSMVITGGAGVSFWPLIQLLFILWIVFSISIYIVYGVFLLLSDIIDKAQKWEQARDKKV